MEKKNVGKNVMKTKPIFVVSGINLFQGGPLSIYYDFLNEALEEKLYEKYNIIAFVYKRELFKKYEKYIKVIELPKSRKNYIFRLWYEYFYFNKISNKVDVDVWLSLHDITPRVKAKKLYTYCHNPSPFMKKDLSNIRYSLTNVLFSFFYKYLYRINIKSNEAIIVQQDWMRKEFMHMYPVKNVIVARPNVRFEYAFKPLEKNNKKPVFIYVAFPRFFKNFEVICEAVSKLQRNDFEVWFTIDGTENKYSEDIYKKYKNLKQIKWLGLLSREEIFERYSKSNCLIFPSVLETWGLPISEYKETGKPILLSDLPYAHETLGDYSQCAFFNPYDADDLANYMCKYLDDKNCLSEHKALTVNAPYADGWKELLDLMMQRK